MYLIKEVSPNATDYIFTSLDGVLQLDVEVNWNKQDASCLVKAVVCNAVHFLLLAHGEGVASLQHCSDLSTASNHSLGDVKCRCSKQVKAQVIPRISRAYYVPLQIATGRLSRKPLPHLHGTVTQPSKLLVDTSVFISAWSHLQSKIETPRAVAWGIIMIRLHKHPVIDHLF